MSGSEDLLKLASDFELFFEASGRAWTDVSVDGVRQTMPVNGRQVQDLLRVRFHAEHGRPPSRDAMSGALEMLQARARHEGPKRRVWRRVATAVGKLYLDLCDDRGRVVEIDETGWRIVDASPVRFARAGGMLSLPEPERGGSLDRFFSLLNIQDAHARIALTSWLAWAVVPDGPHPMLVLQGAPGAAKSTAASLIKALIDPATPATRALPATERDLFLAASGQHVASFDNISMLSASVSDALCKLCTGGGFSARTLFSDADETVITAQAPMILNGIGAFIDRGDLGDRAVVLTLPAISAERRRTRADVEATFAFEHPRLLAALLDIVVVGLRRRSEIRPAALPRMADFARFGIACETAHAQDGDFLRALEELQREALSDDLDADPVAGHIVHFIERHGGKWSGTATELLSALRRMAPNDPSLPRAPNRLSQHLMRASPLLFRAGLSVTRAKSGDRSIALRRLPSESS